MYFLDWMNCQYHTTSWTRLDFLIRPPLLASSHPSLSPVLTSWPLIAPGLLFVVTRLLFSSALLIFSFPLVSPSLVSFFFSTHYLSFSCDSSSSLFACSPSCLFSSLLFITSLLSVLFLFSTLFLPLSCLSSLFLKSPSLHRSYPHYLLLSPCIPLT